jgi:acetylornithine/N-succinyldiaminopimelate aminotransferase
MTDQLDALIHRPHLMAVNARPPQVFVRGEGAWLWDAQGRRYLDWLQGWAVNALGHCHPVLTQALSAQSQRLLTPSPALYNAPSLELAGLLCELSGFDQVFFGSTGAEANETALKLARKWGRLHRGGAFQIITFDNAFHGRNLATMAASGKPGWDAMFAPAMPGFVKARLNDIESVKALISAHTVAVMLEPVQGEAGVWPATQAFSQDLRALCDEHGLLLIFDEVQTGCGRLGQLFGFEVFGVRPDIMTLGKGLGGGVPLSAVLALQHASVFEFGDHGGTLAGNPLMCAVGLAMVQALSKPAFLAQVRERGAQMEQGLRAISQELGLGEVRGKGLLWALELGTDAGPNAGLAVVQTCLALGLLVNAPRQQCLRFMPPLNLTEQELQEGLALLRQAVSGLSGHSLEASGPARFVSH